MIELDETVKLCWGEVDADSFGVSGFMPDAAQAAVRSPDANQANVATSTLECS